MEDLVSELNIQCQQLSSRLALLTREKSHVEQLNRSLESQVRSITLELESLREECIQSHININKTNRDKEIIQAHENTIEDLKQINRALTTENKKFLEMENRMNKFEDVEKIMENMKKVEEEQRKNKEEADARHGVVVNRLNNENAGLRKQIDALTKEVENKTRKIDELMGEIALKDDKHSVEVSKMKLSLYDSKMNQGEARVRSGSVCDASLLDSAAVQKQLAELRYQLQSEHQHQLTQLASTYGDSMKRLQSEYQEQLEAQQRDSDEILIVLREQARNEVAQLVESTDNMREFYQQQLKLAEKGQKFSAVTKDIIVKTPIKSGRSIPSRYASFNQSPYNTPRANRVSFSPSSTPSRKPLRQLNPWLSEALDPFSIVCLTDITQMPTMQPDECDDQCTICRENFSAFIRRHHCRSCGFLVCSNCSTQKSRILWHPTDEVYRCCDLCVVKVKNKIAEITKST